MLLFFYGTKTSKDKKFYSIFFKKLWVSKGQSPLALVATSEIPLKKNKIFIQCHRGIAPVSPTTFWKRWTKTLIFVYLIVFARIERTNSVLCSQ